MMPPARAASQVQDAYSFGAHMYSAAPAHMGSGYSAAAYGWDNGSSNEHWPSGVAAALLHSPSKFLQTYGQ
jgi:hypothetical protein